jgi:hypothetical protein
MDTINAVDPCRLLSCPPTELMRTLVRSEKKQQLCCHLSAILLPPLVHLDLRFHLDLHFHTHEREHGPES